ncbi:MAG: hypothetical protein WBB25_01680 [Sulfitobacter sp.]
MRFLPSAAVSALFGTVIAAQAEGFDPRAGCGEILRSASGEDQTAIAAWTFGFIAANTDNVRPVDPSNNKVILQNIANVCQNDQSVSLLDIVAASATKPEEPVAPVVQLEPGSEAEARALLTEFLDPKADHRALTQAILPTEAEVKAVYADPLGSAMWKSYSEQLGPGVSFAPKLGQTDVVVTYTSTRALFDKRPVLDEFPGGYKEVLQYFKIDVPIVRFKFVEPGETLGLAFDGLIYLNGRWVIMPKPWRSLQN